MPITHAIRDAKQLRKKSGKTGRCLVQGSSGGAVSDNWLLLELCTTISYAKNNSVVSNVPVSPYIEHLRVYSNGGHMDYTMRGTLDTLTMSIYVNDNSMEKIFSRILFLCDHGY